MATHVKFEFINNSANSIVLTDYYTAFGDISNGTGIPSGSVTVFAGSTATVFRQLVNGSIPIGTQRTFQFITNSDTNLINNQEFIIKITLMYYDSNTNNFTSYSDTYVVEIIGVDQGQYYSIDKIPYNCTGFCFVKDTLVLTDKGYVNVQDLKKDDVVVTHDNRHVPIKAVMCRPAVSSPNSDPFLYKANCFSENYPPIDTYLSPHHAVLINDRWDVKGRSDKDLWTHGAHLKYNNLLNDNIQQVKIADSFNYYHIYLPDFKTDHIVINHGLVVEGYGIDYDITHTQFPEDLRVFTVDLKKKEVTI